MYASRAQRVAGNRTRTGGRRGGGEIPLILRDSAVGQHLLQFGDARAGDHGVLEPKLLQVGDILEAHQPRVGDLFRQVKRLPETTPNATFCMAAVVELRRRGKGAWATKGISRVGP